MITLHIEAFIVVVLVVLCAGVIIGRKFKNQS